jgi:Predicted integral membrane protein
MAGFFGFFDYSKPGPGVSKDEPQKASVFLFFELFFRKFWNLIKLNLMFFIFDIPAILSMLVLFLVFMDKPMMDDPLNDMILKFIMGSIFVFIPLITVGPAQCGFSYVLRNYARQEHAFLWWDFKEAAKKNMKESLIISLIDLAVLIVVLFDFRAYSLFSHGSLLMTVASGFFIVAFVIYLMMHMYIYPMLVTFKLPVKQIFKNALIFALMKFLPNLGILLVCAAIVVVTFLNPIIGFILMPIITFSLIGFLTNFYVYPKLKKYMMDKVAPVTDPEEYFGGDEDEEEGTEEEKDEDSDFKISE